MNRGSVQMSSSTALSALFQDGCRSAGLPQGTLTQSVSQVTTTHCSLLLQSAPYCSEWSVGEKSRLTETLLGTWTHLLQMAVTFRLLARPDMSATLLWSQQDVYFCANWNNFPYFQSRNSFKIKAYQRLCLCCRNFIAISTWWSIYQFK